MKTEIKNINLKENWNNKEIKGFYKAMAVLDNQGNQLFNIRFYSTGSTNHCKINGKGFSGYGKAGGYGYCKESQALENAFENAGIEFINLGGTGRIYEACKMAGWKVLSKRKVNIITITE